MNKLKRARKIAREQRDKWGCNSSELLACITKELSEEHGIEIVRAKKTFLNRARGTVVPEEGCLYYEQSLENKPEELLEVVAHEYGHIVLHEKRFQQADNDLLKGSAFLSNGATALSRYSPKAKEEAEANAFAAELICPAPEVFEAWLKSPGITLDTLAQQFNATDSLVRLQLAEGLIQRNTGEPPTPKRQGVVTIEQEQAATMLGIPVIVDAGPGTGKTRTLVRRVQFLVEENNADPEKILILTFSNEAANELEERLAVELGNEIAQQIRLSTFHGFGVELLHKLGHHIGLSETFTILDEPAQVEMVSKILATVDCDALLKLKDIEATVAEVVSRINYLKDRLVEPSRLELEIDAWDATNEAPALERAKALLRLFKKYEEVKSSKQSVDFSDLILLPFRLLEANEELRSELSAQFPWVMVDEYQDVSRATAFLLRNICNSNNPPWVVGDQRQAIYRFRGASPENVSKFSNDFPGARQFQLTVNYRSSQAVIDAANELAKHITVREHGNPKAASKWTAGREIKSVGQEPIVLADANCDAAERDNIVKIVRSWLKDNIPAEDIAILARRNVDVRNLAIELKKNGIRAITTGLLTAEGAGGDLTAVLASADRKAAGLPRLVYALYRNQASPLILDKAITELRIADRDSEHPPICIDCDKTESILTSIWPAVRALRLHRHSLDGWATLCDFLFFHTAYLRSLIENKADTQSEVQIDEVLSTLAVAASYRASHPHEQPKPARLGLTDLLRSQVSKPSQGLVPPNPQPGAVRVMTCHASKGLEFPCVIVSGQNLANIRRKSEECLPPLFRADEDSDSLQADSLLFVGLTRAINSAIVSHAITAGGRPKSPKRKKPGLLKDWWDSNTVPKRHWIEEPQALAPEAVGRIWGGNRNQDFTSYTLSPEVCTVRTYLEDELGIEFITRTPSLYPRFVSILQKLFREAIETAVSAGSVYPNDSELEKLFEKEWPSERYASHPHQPIYRSRASNWLKRLRKNFPSNWSGKTVLDNTISFTKRSVTWSVNLPIVSRINNANGSQTVIILRVQAAESKDEVLWSNLVDHKRLAFVLLQEESNNINPVILDADDGKLRQFRWKKSDKNEAMKLEASRARQLMEALYDGRFETKRDDYQCDKCRVRLVCPLWIGVENGSP